MLPTAVQCLLNRGHHLVTWHELLNVGVTSMPLQRFLRAGLLVRIRHRVYVDGRVWEQLPAGPPRELLKARAVSRVMPGDHVLSHDSAAHALGLAFLAEAHPWVHVSRPKMHGDRPLEGVKQHRAEHLNAHVVEFDDLKVLDPARTALDLARQHGMPAGLSACDSALRMGITPAQLSAALAPMVRWRGVTVAREAAAWADPGAENPGESLARLAVISLGMGIPVTQFPLLVGRTLVWGDLRLGPQIIEFDGQVKYRPRAEGGVAVQDPGRVAWEERQRERAIQALGFGVSRIVWDDLLPRNWSATLDRLRAEIAETAERADGAKIASAVRAAEHFAPQRERRIFGSTPAA